MVDLPFWDEAASFSPRDSNSNMGMGIVRKENCETEVTAHDLVNLRGNCTNFQSHLPHYAAKTVARTIAATGQNPRASAAALMAFEPTSSVPPAAVVPLGSVPLMRMVLLPW